MVWPGSRVSATPEASGRLPSRSSQKTLAFIGGSAVQYNASGMF